MALKCFFVQKITKLHQTHGLRWQGTLPQPLFVIHCSCTSDGGVTRTLWRERARRNFSGDPTDGPNPKFKAKNQEQSV